MMDHRDAINRLEDIHRHLARTEVYRGYRAAPVALTGVVAVAAAGAQASVLPSGPPELFALYWTGIAVVAAGVGFAGAAWGYLRETSPTLRRRTRIVVGQFVPCVAAGLVVTTLFVHSARDVPALVAYLPGLWALLFSLGVFASQPYLHSRIGWVGAGYFAAGTILLFLAPSGLPPSPWTVGIPFGLGQLSLAAAIYWNLERPENADGS